MAAVGLVSISLMVASYQVDARSEARFQVAGEVRDSAGEPLTGVRAVLFLQDPNLLTKTILFHQLENAAGMSDGYGLFKARVVKKYGSKHSWLFGLGKPIGHPFKNAWLLLRKENYGQMAVKLNSENWQDAGNDWQSINAKLPVVTLSRGPLHPESQ